jgi:hypothetical protein
LEDNIKMDLQELEFGAMDWFETGSGQGQVEGTCECGNVGVWTGSR